ncbi:formimidoylglutamase [Rubrivirga sp. S365]|uniref:Formimidoylglutamase n=1 Tax=Rubrivirga litoralis TaxID=3075598 RepID=A0ABU3BN51_9BACT|nr:MULTISPECIES: formimidoylglutamase [unclassified Rubrivirga]MDT0630706.1 formimidoylglutamase [Rubrivirga sp. F394]MDT7856278.1 formimidoylglutamase [Rubrivirga sp. S365]
MSDPRLGDWLRDAPLATDTRVALVGFPSDEGVRRNGGRPGAAQAPAEIRAALARMTPDARRPAPFVGLLERTADVGDVEVTGDLEADQARLGERVGGLLARGVVPIVLGGGHETAYGHFLGYVRAGRPVRALNWDAHADVRPPADGRGHSGSPFRQLLDHDSGLCRGYTVAGLLPWRVAADHAAIAEASGGVVWADDLTAERADALVASLDGPTLASFDLDAVDAARGVSAPGVGGLSTAVWLRAAEVCGRSAHVQSVDVVELNPAHDTDGRTVVLAALTVWHVLRGLAARTPPA